MPKGELKEYPGGFKVLYGGTRKAPTQFSRPWQLPIPVQTDPEKCLFCKRDQVIVLGKFENGWHRLQNKFTPHSWHEMVIPDTCWPEEEMRVLGGVQRIYEALTNIKEVVEAAQGKYEVWVNAYVGVLAGQNISHLHYHVLEPERFREGESSYVMATAMRAINSRDEAFRMALLESMHVVAVGGDVRYRAVAESIFRVGQCFFVPSRIEEFIPRPFAHMLYRVACLYAEAFRSMQGLSPDFQLFFRFSPSGFLGGSYLPILNNHGSTESVGAVMLGGPFVHPWTPDETMEILGRVK